MWIECFEKDARFDGADIESLVEQLIEHVHATHDVPELDEEPRMWGRNFAEASVREDGPVQRLQSIGSVLLPASPFRRRS